MIVLAIDPGTNESAYLYWDGASNRLWNFDIIANETLLALLRSSGLIRGVTCAIESLVNYGSTVGDETFQTCLWAGRFYEAWHFRTDVGPKLVNRRDIKLHHCGTARATDASISDALKVKYGLPGTKRNPGPLYGIKSHLWSALAIATYITETRREAAHAAPREIAAP